MDHCAAERFERFYTGADGIAYPVMSPTPERASSTSVAEPATVAAPPPRAPLAFLGLACAVGVSTIYYNQPLLLEMARSLHVPPAQIGQVAVATQLGYALGIFLFAPLGDVVERRSLMVRLFAAVAASMLASALAPNFGVLLVASVVTGLTAAVTHVAVPIAPELAADEDRGRAVGVAMTGLLLGILLARAFSGALGHWFGWRSVFYVGAALNLLFVPLLLRGFPRLPPRHPVRYAHALRSLWTIVVGEALLRESALIGGLVFAAFSVFCRCFRHPGRHRCLGRAAGRAHGRPPWDPRGDELGAASAGGLLRGAVGLGVPHGRAGCGRGAA